MFAYFSPKVLHFWWSSREGWECLLIWNFSPGLVENYTFIYYYMLQSPQLAPVRNLQRCTAPQNRFKIAVQLNYSCLAAF